jgi:hypothetical protein
MNCHQHRSSSHARTSPRAHTHVHTNTRTHARTSPRTHMHTRRIGSTMALAIPAGATVAGAEVAGAGVGGVRVGAAAKKGCGGSMCDIYTHKHIHYTNAYFYMHACSGIRKCMWARRSIDTRMLLVRTSRHAVACVIKCTCGAHLCLRRISAARSQRRSPTPC